MSDFASLKHLLLPSGATPISAPADSWSAVLARGTSSSACLRVREPAAFGTSTAALLRFASERELVLARLARRPPTPYSSVQVIRTRPSVIRPSPLRAIRARLAAGAAVLLSDGSPSHCRLEEAVAASRLEGVLQLRPGSGGVLLVTGRREGQPVLLRVGPPDALPAAAAAGLRYLRASCLVPRLVASSRSADLAWTVEEMLPGRRPARLRGGLLEDAVTFAAAMPRARTQVASPVVQDLVRALPQHAAAVDDIGSRALAVVRDQLPVVAVHGDFWAGNLLAGRGRLTGVVDWDAFRSSGPAGVDLLHLLASEDRHRHGRSTGAEVLCRPWADPALSAVWQTYWRAAGVHPAPGALDALGAVWWLEQVASTISRSPERAADSAWVDANVTPVLKVLGR